MSNKNKFIDRSPIICAAGLQKKFDPLDTTSNCLKQYTLQDKIVALKHVTGVKEKEMNSVEYKRQKMDNFRHKGIYSSLSDLTPKVETRYQTLISDLKDTTMDSFWNKQLGEVRDPIGNIPPGLDTQTTFGMPSKQDITLKELVNPPKSVYQVLYESQEAHDWYKKTHNDYNPGEQVSRNYCSTFDKNKRFGERNEFDPEGRLVRCSMKWIYSEPVTYASQIQADYIKRTHHTVGKCLTPNENIKQVPSDHRFGKMCERPLHGAAELLMDSDASPSTFKREYYEWINHLNELRRYIKRRAIDLIDLASACLYYDTEKTGWLQFDVMYKIFNYKMLTFNHEMMKPFTTYLGLLQNEMIRYQEFIDILDVNKEVPDFGKLEDVSKNNLYFVTASMDARCDFLTIDNSRMPPAGIPSIRFDLERPVVREGCIKADLESLGDETSAGALINPSIYTNYGISHMDLFMPRKPELLRRLFENIGYKFPGNIFDEVWKVGVEEDRTGLVCIDTFKRLIDKAAPLKRIDDKLDVC